MITPVGPGAPLFPTSGGESIPMLARQLQEQVSSLSDHVKLNQQDSTLCRQVDFLTEFAKQVQQLHSTVNRAMHV